MKLFIIVMAIYCCANCFAYNDERSFEDLLSIWVNGVAWSEKDGFSLSVVSENPPELIHLKGDYVPVPLSENGYLKLSRGKHYVFTNGSGRTQELKFVDPVIEGEGPDSLAVQIFGCDTPVLYFKHAERFSRNGDWVLRSWLISSNGNVYDVGNRTFQKFVLPFVASVKPSIREREKNNMLEVAQGNLGAAQNDLDKAIVWFARNPDQIPVAVGVTNEVCCCENKSPNLDCLTQVVQNETLSPELRAKFISRLKQEENDDKSERALVCRSGDGVGLRIIGLSEGLANGCFRRISYDVAGNVVLIIQNVPLCTGYWVRGFADGKLRFRLDISSGKIDSFWVLVGDDYVKSNDDALAKKFLDEALEFWNKWK